ncbi:MAG TPA: hypothetical protein PLG38_10935 [Propionibacteriaceae bacterium]|nr:hypothetical protein [Propionibacteriaceae bacterium]HQE32514.1 hypothetical protein [Propionibacteriaceae bacterium]
MAKPKQSTPGCLEAAVLLLVAGRLSVLAESNPIPAGLAGFAP